MRFNLTVAAEVFVAWFLVSVAAWAAVVALRRRRS